MMLVLLALGLAAAASDDEKCFRPGQCAEPSQYRHKRVAAGVSPRLSWSSDGGYEAAASIQAIALGYGAYLSQETVRKAAKKDGRRSAKNGYEIFDDNVGGALDALGFTHAPFTNPGTSSELLVWLKFYLSRGTPVLGFFMVRGGTHCPGDPCASENATYDTALPIYGLYSNSSLDDAAVYGGDVLQFAAPALVPNGAENLGYFRRFDTLTDTTAFDGNCSDASKEGDHAAAYPCTDDRKSFAVAITGLKSGPTLPITVAIKGYGEPDVTLKDVAPSRLVAVVTVSSLVEGERYVIFRFDRGNGVVPNATKKYFDAADWCLGFVADGTGAFVWQDPHEIVSNATVAYRSIRDHRKGGRASPAGQLLRL